ncbi:MAG: 4-alpha-glucanotransferase [Deltaproteobacteria bacterium]
MNERKSGILLHITSLPSKFGIGDFGPAAREFIDFLSRTGQRYWQVLPLNPTELIYGNSPYSGPSSFAGNPILISPELMIDKGYLSFEEPGEKPRFENNRVHYESVYKHKSLLLKKAFHNVRDRMELDPDFKKFCTRNEFWLEDYSLYSSVKTNLKCGTWKDFPEDLKNRDRNALDKWREKIASEILYTQFTQYVFFEQWYSLKSYANERGIEIIGDIPYYINYDSSDVWTNPGMFKLDDEKNPKFVAGVPPDYFSETGQLWGNPVYDWKKLKETGYEWWIKRIGHNLSMFDILRLDHFRGFVSYWEVRAGEKTALNGKWVDPGAEDFFDTLFNRYDTSNFIAEDLGYITPDVKEIIRRYGLPGMKILLFAFGEDFPYGDYLPENFGENCVVYTGTHDNNTVTGWWNTEAGNVEKERFRKYIDREIEGREIHWEFIRLAMESPARTAIIPMQDVLGLGAGARMNKPSTSRGNWEWRLKPGYITPEIKSRLKEITEINRRD